MRSRSTKRDNKSKTTIPVTTETSTNEELSTKTTNIHEKSLVLPEDTSFIYPISYAQSEPFTKPHTITVLILLVFAFGYALFTHKHVDEKDQDKNNIAR